MEAYTNETSFDEFAFACEQFEKLLGELRSESARVLEHGEVELLIVREGNELLRRLMQGYLDQRTAAEERGEGVTGADGEERRHCRARSRSLVTLFGEVTVGRLGYSGARLESVFPLDGALNLPPNKYSQGVRRKVGLEVAKGSFEEAVKAIQEGTGAEVPKRQAEELSRAISADFDKFYARPPVAEDSPPVEQARTPEEEARAPEEGAGNLLVMSTDGKGIVVRKQDLREATRKKAEATRRRTNLRPKSRTQTLHGAGKIADDVIAHLTGLVGADVTVTLEIHAGVRSGVPDNVVRTVTEYCRTLRFSHQGFEKE